MNNLSKNGLLLVDLSNYSSYSNNIYLTKVNRLEYLTDIELIQATIPYTFWNVRANFNNILYINDGVNPTWTITITPNVVYTFTTLAAEIQTQLIATIGAGWTCAYNALTYKFTIARVGNFTIYTPLTPYTARLLGFSSTANLAGAATYSSTLLPIMQSTRFITVHSKALSNYIAYSYPIVNTKNNDKLIAYIDITQNTFGDLIAYEPKLKCNFKFEPKKEYLEIIDFYFKDEFGLPVDFNSIHPILNFKIKMDPKYHGGLN
jgi:hypothetical protein